MYLIDGGADISVIKHSTVKFVNSIIKPNDNIRAFLGIAAQAVYTTGLCDLNGFR